MEKGLRGTVHPGEILKEAVIEANGLTVTKAAYLLGITRAMLSNIINGKSSITPSMAIRIAKVFGGEPRVWINLQSAFSFRVAQEQFEANPPDLHPFEHVS